jgi:hypothetical protein
MKKLVGLFLAVSVIAVVGCADAGKASIYDEPILGGESVGAEVSE